MSTNHTSTSTVVLSSSSVSQHQHQNMPATSPLSQFTPNGEVQKLRTTTPPQNLSNLQSQQRGNFTNLTIVSYHYFERYARNIHRLLFLYT